MCDEGVIKYQLRFEKSTSLHEFDYSDLNDWHRQFKAAAILGQDSTRYGGLGFGNLSVRIDQGSFLISGTQTGGLDKLTADDYALVTRTDVSQNLVEARGQIKPSSESLTHAAIYALDDRVKYVFHVHSPAIWQARSQLGIPCSGADIAYGTPQMAAEIKRLQEANSFAKGNILAMGGHEDGVIGFGFDAAEAGEIILRYLHIAEASGRL